MKAKVYFTREITPEKVVEMYDAMGVELPGKMAVKVHSGEKGNQNFLRPEFWRPMVDKVQGTIVECNTAYGDATTGVRDNTPEHLKLIEEHGWTKYFDVDLMDAEGPDVTWPIPDGKILKENKLGKHIENYDSMLVLAHFKGHPMGGYGGALKQLAIGCASRAGKALIHSAGKTDDRFETWQQHADSVAFPEAMADAASSVTEHFKGKIAFINVMKNLSVDCDCCAVAEDPCMKDIGILASTDPVAIDQACMDLVMNSDDPGKEELFQKLMKYQQDKNAAGLLKDRAYDFLMSEFHEEKFLKKNLELLDQKIRQQDVRDRGYWLHDPQEYLIEKKLEIMEELHYPEKDIEKVRRENWKLPGIRSQELDKALRSGDNARFSRPRSNLCSAADECRPRMSEAS